MKGKTTHGRTIRISAEAHAALTELAKSGFRTIAGTVEWLLQSNSNALPVRVSPPVEPK